MTDINPIHELRRQHLQGILEKSGLKRVEFAKKIGISPSYLSQMLTIGFRFGEKAARNFEINLKLSKGAFDKHKSSDLLLIDSWATPEDLPPSSFCLVPRVSINAEHTPEDTPMSPPMAFKTDWIRRQNVSCKTNLRTCEITGDAMEPYLQSGDDVLIDIGQNEVADHQVYAIQYGEEIRVKRLSKRFDGGLLIGSDNPRYPGETLNSTEATALKVIGKVIWRGGGVAR